MNNSKMEISKGLLLVSTIILTWISLILIFSTGFFLFHVSLGPWNVIIPSVLILPLWFWVSKKGNVIRLINRALILTGSIFIILVSFVGASFIYDNSYDGQNYQQMAVIALSNGYNPIYQTLQPATNSNIEINHYPKASWIVEAAIYQVSQNIEAGKGLNILLLCVSFLICLSFLLRFPSLDIWKAVLIAGIAACNPVAISQLWTFYVDGLVSSLYLIVLVLMFYYYWNPKWITLLPLICSVVISLNIKFTATAYIAIICSSLFLVFSLVKREWKFIFSLSSGLALAVIIGLLWVGYNPYIINSISYGNPFYPVYGGHSPLNEAALMGGQAPSDFENKSQVSKLFRDLFSRSENAFGAVGSHLKIPFTFSMGEIEGFLVPDMRVGGFGPLFGGLLLCSLCLLGLLFYFKWKTSLVILFLVLFILLSSFPNEENWWARYAPQLWLMPVCIITLALMIPNQFSKIIGYVLIGIFTINLAMVSWPNVYYNIHETRTINAVLENLANSGQEYEFYLGTLAPWTLKLDRLYVRYHLVSSLDQLNCPKQLQWIEYSLANCP